MNNPSAKLVKIGEAAKILGVSIDTLRRWEKAGKIEAIRTPGGTRLFKIEQPQTDTFSTKDFDSNTPSPKSFVAKFLIGTAALSVVTLALTAWISASYLTAPKDTQRFFKNNIASPLLKPFHKLAEYAVAVISPEQAKQLGFLHEKEPPPLPLKAHNLQPDILAVTASPQFLEVNSDTQINGSLYVRDSINGAILEATPSSSTITLASGGTTLTVSDSAEIDQDVSTTSSPTFSSLTLSSTTNQLSSGGFKFTLPGATTTFVGTDTTQTLTKKSLSGSANTFTNIPNSALVNSKVTVTAGTNLTGGGDVNLGSSITIALKDSPTISGVISLADGTAAAPSLTFTNDADTGLYRVSSNTLGFVTGGVERFNISSSGHVLPTLDDTYNLGSSSFRWLKLFAEDGNFSDDVSIGDALTVTGSLTVQGTTLATTGNIETSGSLSVGSSVFIGGGLGVVGNTSIGTTALYVNVNTNRVGINTSAPASTLAVLGNAGIGVSFAGQPSPVNGLAIQGNVGIGITTANSALTIAGGAVIGTGYNLTAPSNGLLVQGLVGIGNTAPGNTLAVTGGLNLGTFASSTGPTNGLVVSGNVGIGTTSPSTALHIIGSTTTRGHILADINNLYDIGSAAITYRTIYANEINATTLVGTLSAGNLTASTFTINSDNATDDAEDANLRFYRGTASTHALLTWDSTAKEFDLNSQLHLTGTITSTNGIMLDSVTNDIITPGNETLALIPGGTGNVGINTTSPYAKLQVKGAGTGTGISFLTTDSSGTQRLAILDNGNVGIGITNPSASLTVHGNAGIGYTNVAIPSNGLAVSGNVGVGTTSPLQALHVVGQCVTGDTKLKRRKRKKNGNWTDEYEDVDIKDIQPGDEILTLDEATGEFIPQKVEKLMDMGMQAVFGLKTSSGKYIKTTANHPYLAQTKPPKIISGVFEIDISGRVEEMNKDTYLALANSEASYVIKLSAREKKILKKLHQEQKSYPKFGFQIYAQLIRIAIRLSGFKVNRLIVDIDYAGSNKDIESIIKITYPDLLIQFSQVGKSSAAHRAAYLTNTKSLKPSINMSVGQFLTNKKETQVALKGTADGTDHQEWIPGFPSHRVSKGSYHQINKLSMGETKWIKVSQLNKGDKIATMDGWEYIIQIDDLGRKQTYDIEVEGTHNFVGNNIVAHNTYINSGLNIGAAFTGGAAVPSNGLAVQGNVGIGITTANSTLSVAGSAHIGGIRQGISAPTDGLFVDGNVGIGATTSSNKLDVWGNARITGTLTLDSNFTLSGGQFLANNGTASLPSYSFTNLTNAGLWTNGNGLLLTTGGSNTSGITVTGAGNVGIGITSPSQTFQVNSGASSTVINSSGNIGIGTTSPLSALSVVGGGVIGTGYGSLIAPTSGLLIQGLVGIGTTAPGNTLAVNGGLNLGTFASNTGPSSGLAVSGNVGVGTTSPLQALHVVGQCVTGDTRLRRRRKSKKRNSKSEIDEWEEVRIDQIKPGDEILTLDEHSGEFIPSTVKGLMDMGIQKTYLLITETGKQIRTTAEHPYLVKAQLFTGSSLFTKGYIGESEGYYQQSEGYLTLSHDLIEIHNSSNSISALTARYQAIVAANKSPVNTSGSLAAKAAISQTTNKFDDIAEKTLNWGFMNNTLSQQKAWVKVSQLKTGMEIATVDGWEKIVKIKEHAREQVWDIEVENTHNFVGNNIVAHNTYINSGLNIGAAFTGGAATISNGLAVSGNVGIGITTANSNLSVSGNAHIGSLYQGTAAPSNGLFVDGNVGIGATTSSNLLDVWGNARIAGTLTVDGNLTTGNITGPTTGTIGYFSRTTNPVALVYPTTITDTIGTYGNIGIGTTNPAQKFQVNTGTSATVIDSSGNLGIGKSSPVNILEIGGSFPLTYDNTSGRLGINTNAPAYNLEIQTNGTNVLNLKNTSTTGYSTIYFSNTGAAGRAQIWLNATSQTDYGGANSLNLYNGANAPIAFFTNGASTPNMVVTGSGNVGIGTTGPGTTFAVIGNSTIGFGNSATSPAGPSSGLAVSGNVGVGTTSPLQALHVVGQCVTGDTKLKRRKRKKNGTWSDDYEDVEIKDIKEGDQILSLNEKTGKFEPHQVKGLLDMGIQDIYQLITQNGKRIRTTGTHPYLIREIKSEILTGTFEVDQSNRIENLAKDSFIALAQTSYDKPQVFIVKLTKQLKKDTFKHYRKDPKRFGPVLWARVIKSIITAKNIEGKIILDKEYPGYQPLIDQIVSKDCKNISVEFKSIGKSSPAHEIGYEAATGKKLANKKATGALAQYVQVAEDVLHPEFTGIRTPSSRLSKDYQKLDKLSTAKWIKVYDISLGSYAATTDGWEKIISLKKVSREQVWDIEVENTHNFVGNNIVAHNTYITGNVGLGVTTPGATLAINGNSVIGYSGVNIAGPSSGLAVSGNVGIGITTANSTLSVAGNTHIGSLYQETVAPTNGLFVDGNVGIGATTSSNKLDVWGNARIAGTLTLDSNLSLNGGQFLANNGTASLPSYSFTSSTSTGMYSPSVNALSLQTNGASTPPLTITAGGNVGIGITSPALGLEVSATLGRIRITSTTNSNNVGLQLSAKGASGTAAQGGLYFVGNETAGSRFISLTGDDSTYQLVVTQAGNVGIGFTTPDRLLQTASDINIVGSNSSLLGAAGTQFALTGSSATGLQKKLVLGIDTTDNYGVIQAGNTDGTNYTLSLNPAGGNVGIGTTSPLGILDVNPSAATSGNGLPILLTAQQGSSTGTGGALTLTSGAGGSTSGASGGITLQVGTVTTSGNAGALQILGAAGVGSNNVGSTITVTAGASVGSGTGGAVNLNGGVGGTTTSTGGAINLTGANSSSDAAAGTGGAIVLGGGTSGTSVAGAAISITAGTGSNNGGATGGAVTIAGGLGGGGNSNGGAVIINGGAAGGLGNNVGGAITLTSGAGLGSQTSGITTVTTGAPGPTGASGALNLTTGAGGSTSGNSGDLTLRTGSITGAGNFPGSILFQTNGANTRMFIDNAGNVGIGASNPATAKLSIQGNVGIGYTSVSIPANGLAVSGNVGIGITTANSNLSINGNAHIGGIRQGIAAPANGLFVDGNVGIGATTSSNLLDVWGNARITGTLTVDSTLTNSSVFRAANGSASAPAYSFTNLTNAGLWTNGDGLLLTTGGSNTSGITVTGAGNIGIGTTNPLSPLHILTSSNPFIRLQDTGANRIVYFANNSSRIYLGSDQGVTGRKFSIDVGAPDDVMFIDSNGNVGIRTATPNSTVAIQGNVGIGFTGASQVIPSNGLAVFGNVGIGITTANSSLTVNGGVSIGSSNITAPTNGLFVLGNVGIGVTTPSVGLALSTNALIGYTGVNLSGPSSGLAVSGNVGIGITTANSALTVNGGVSIGSSFNVTAPANGLLVQGNVGIGFSTPDRLLQVGSDITGFGNALGTILGANGSQLVLTGSTANTLNKKLTFALDSTNNVGVIQVGANLGVGTTAAYNLSLNPLGGNVGIGTSSPLGIFEVNPAAATSGNGLPILLTAQQGSSTGTGGALTLTSGAGGSTSGASGGITLQVGTVTTSGNAGALQILGAAGVASNNVGSTITMTAGNSVGSGTGGAINLNGGVGGATSGTAGGAISLTGGSSGNSPNEGIGGAIVLGGGTTGTSVAGAAISITAGQGSNNGGATGGAVTIAGGLGGGGNSNGGAVIINGGAAGGLGSNVGGAITLTSGAGLGSQTSGITTVTTGAPGPTGASGALNLTTGAGGSTSGNSGDLTLRTGSITGAGNFPGSILFQTNGANTRMFIDNAGNVGIGASNPATAKLSIQGNVGIGYTSVSIPANGLAVSGNVGVGITTANSTLSVAGNAHIGSLRQGIAAPTNGLFVDGNVGIGATTSSNLLDVWGNARITGTLTLDSNFTLSGGQFLANNGTASLPSYSFTSSTSTGMYSPSVNALSLQTNGASTPPLTITAGGNVGIGITSPSQAFQVNSGASSTVINSSGNVGIGTTSPNSALSVVGGGVIGTGYGGLVAPTSGLLVQGLVGIGTTAPGNTLAVNGGLNLGTFASNTGPTNGLAVSGNVGIGITTANSALTVNGGVSIGSSNIVAPTNGLFVLGNVGIGFTTPDRLLQTASDINIVGSNVSLLGAAGTQFGISGSSATGLQKKLVLGIDTTDNYGVIQAGNTDGTNYALALNPAGGNVGIGTTSPGAILHIAGSTDGSERIRIQNTGSGGKAWDIISTTLALHGVPDGSLLFNDTVTNTLVLNSGNVGVGTVSPSQRFQVNANASNPFVVTSGGNVGIGFTTPGSLLHIRGSGATLNLESTDTNLAILNADSTANTSGASVALFRLRGGDSLGNLTEYSAIRSMVSIATDGSEQGRLDFLTINNGSTGARMTITGGNVGIGITSPGTTLAVNGNSTIGYSGVNIAGPSSGLAVSGNVGVGITTANSALTVNGGVSIGSSNIVAPTNGLFVLGNVGIGFTTPDRLLQTASDINIVGSNVSLLGAAGTQFGISGSSATGLQKKLVLGIDTTDNYGVIQAGNTDGTNYSLSLNPAGGNVGIGTTTTSQLFQINYASSNPVVITSGGNVGIGFTSPAAKLEVDTNNPSTKGTITKGNTSIANNPLTLASQFTRANSEELTVNDNASLSMGSGVAMTMTAWIYLDSTGIDQGVVGKGTHNVNANIEYDFNISGTSLFFSVGDGTSAGGPAASTVTTGTWYFFVGWFDPTTQTLYSQLNNGTANTLSWTTYIQDSSQVFRIGNLNSVGFLNGRVAGVGLWKRALTATERTQLYNNGYGLPYSGLATGLKSSLISYWNLSESSGSRADSQGSNTLTDTNTVTGNPGPGTGTVQTNLTEWQNSLGTVLGSVSGNGNFLVQPDSYTATAFNVKDPLGNALFVVDTANNGVGIGTTAPSQLFQINAPGSNPFVVTSGGNVGIGLTTPSASLSVGGNVGIGFTNVVIPSFGLAVKGNVGIGTTSPRAPLEVVANPTGGSSQAAALFLNGNVGIGTTATGFNNLQVEGSIGVGTSYSPGTYKLDVAGTVRAVGYFGRCGTGTDATQCNQDVAEIYSSSEDVGMADLLVIDSTTNNTVSKTTKPYQNNLIGIVSTSPGLLLGINGSDVALGSEASDYPQNADPRLPAVALTGKVPLKVSTENGPIEVGDYLTSSSTRGVAMKALRPGPVIGKALEPFDGAQGDQGRILVFVNVSYADPGNFFASLSFDNDGNLIIPKIRTASIILDPSVATASGQLTMDNGQLTIAEDPAYTSAGPQLATNSNTSVDLSGKLASLEERVVALEAKVQKEATPSASIAEATPSAELASLDLTPPDLLLATPSAQLADLNTYSEATVSGMLAAYQAEIQDSFKVFGETSLAKTAINGDLTIDGTLSIDNGSELNVIGTLFLQKSLLAEKVDIFNGKVTIDKEGNIKTSGEVAGASIVTNKLTISNTPIASSSASPTPTIGSGKILAGQTSTIIPTTQATATSKIFVTPRAKIGTQALVVDSVTNGGEFKVSLDHPLPDDLTFDWWIVQTN